MTFTWRLLLVACLSLATECKTSEEAPNKNFKRVEGTNSYELSVKDDDMMQMYQKWMDTGMSSLFSAIANKKLKKHRKSIATKFGECSTSADDLIKHAKCLKQLLNHKFDTPKPKKFNRFNRYRQHRVGDEDEESGFKQQLDENTVRSKREIKSAKGYRMKGSKVVMTPMMQIAKSIYDSVKQASNKTELPKWQNTIESLKTNGKALKKKRKDIEDTSDESLATMGLQGLKRQVNRNDIQFEGELEDIQKDPAKLKRLMAEIKKKKGNTPEAKVMDIVRSAMEMGYNIAGQNTSRFYNSTMRIASPKFLELFPDSGNDTVNLISPSLFALHESDDPIENLTSIPNLLKGFGLQEHQLWLDVIMEAAGELKEAGKNQTAQMVDMMKEMVDENNVPLYPTEQNATEWGESQAVFDFWTKVRDSYTKDQLRELNHTGYAILNKEQITLLYGPESRLYNKTKYERLMSMNEEEIHEEMENQIQMMAEMESFKLRKKDVVLSATLFTWVVLNPTTTSQPFILAPLLFDPIILSPSIYGAVILTPWVFVPFVLSPRVLGCIILAPWLFSPLILTPIALHPAILSPGLFNPLILSPLVLVPFILSPQVFTPIILSPLCLDPVILNPLVGSPLILSPFVLTPTILSPHFLGGLIMSPYVLSPVLLSPLTAFVALLSPSWLS
uniref:Uncharacterized protein n=1 Tax=Bursaphelenchus xylophilus TaxID=6326 RepID=A0A1I7SC79_BURXY